MDAYDQQLMTAVVDKAEHAGKQVKPLIVQTNNPLHAVLQTAIHLQAGAGHRGVEQVHGRRAAGANRVLLDQHAPRHAGAADGAHPRPRARHGTRPGRRQSHPQDQRAAGPQRGDRAAGVGVDRVLLLHDGSRASSDLFKGVLTLLDPQVVLAVLPVSPDGDQSPAGAAAVHADEERAQGRPQSDSPRHAEGRRPGDRRAAATRPVRSGRPAAVGGDAGRCEQRHSPWTTQAGTSFGTLIAGCSWRPRRESRRRWWIRRRA